MSSTVGTFTTSGTASLSGYSNASSVSRVITGITGDGDGDVWFPDVSTTEGFFGQGGVTTLEIGEFSTAGQIIESPLLTNFTSTSSGGGITVGSDGNLYFTFNNQVGQEVLTGGSPTTFNQLPNPNGGTLTAQKQDITTGSDGNIWYTQQSPAAIVQLSIVPVTPTFGMLAAPTITYGTPSSTLLGQTAAGTAIPTGNVSITVDGVTQTSAIDQTTGGFSSTFDTSALGVAGSPYTITYAYAGSTGFSQASATSTLTVNPAALTITASDASKTFGQAADFAATAFTTSGLLNDDAVASVTETSIGSAATAAVGTYPIVPSSATFSTGASTNYTIAYANGMLTVNQATPTVTWAQPADITIGTALGSRSLMPRLRWRAPSATHRWREQSCPWARARP